MTPFASVAILEKLALSKIARCKAPALNSRLFRSLACGDVHDGTEHTCWLARPIQRATAAHPDPADRFIYPLNLRFEIPSSATLCSLKLFFNSSAELGQHMIEELCEVPLPFLGWVTKDLGVTRGTGTGLVFEVEFPFSQTRDFDGEVKSRFAHPQLGFDLFLLADVGIGSRTSA